MLSQKQSIQMNAGFTLIELMIVIVIVAVLLAVALPAYQNQVIRGHRASAKAELLEIANRQEQYMLANRSYATVLTELQYTAPVDVSARYTFSISSISNSLPYFEITATAQGAQLSDGNLTLDSEGVRDPEEKWTR